LGEPELVADHRREEGDLSIPVTTGAQYRFGGVISQLPDFLSSRHLDDIARFAKGDLYKRSLVDDLRRAIVATGLVSSITLAPRETVAPLNGQPGTLVLDAAMAKAPLRTIAGAVGYDSGEGFRLEASWEHRNLFPPEGLLRLRAVAGTQEQLAGVTLRRNNFRGRDQVLNFDLYGNLVKRTAYVAKTLAATASFEKLTTLIFQKPWVWSVGLEAIATNERPGDTAGISAAPQTYYVLALPLRAAVDTSDNLLDPTRGFRAALRVSPEASLSAGRKHGYVRIQADASVYLPLGKAAVVAARVRLGAIAGADIGDIAPSRRFYAGGGGSVRGFAFQEIGPRDALGLPSGGRSLSEFSLEARVKTGLFGGGLSLVPFIDGGNANVESTPHFRDLRFGAGLGLRYQTGFGPIRLDVATPIARRAGESPVAVYVSLGQAF
jgi:translocation and assembly module TamA